MFKKMLRTMVATFTVICTMMSGMTVHAESAETEEEKRLYENAQRVVQVMTKGLIMPTPDGERFDPAYYALSNPDVAAVTGPDPTALYNHYLTRGKAEGRQPNRDSKKMGIPLTQDEYTRGIIALVNQAREKEGAPALSESETLDRDAAQRAYEIDQLFSHTRPDGTPYYTLDPEHMIGENIAMVISSPSERVFNLWMSSDGHRENILNPCYSSIGIGYYVDSTNGRYYVVQNFGVGN